MVICYFGDSLTLGYGDEKGLGWPGRLSMALREKGQDVTSYNLGVRKDTSVQLQHRWKSEAMLRRMPDQPFKMVFSFGVADVANGVPSEQTLASCVAILTQAKAMGDVMVVGPTPVNDQSKREEITTLSRMIAGLCKRVDIPFVPTIDSMHRSFVYGTALNDGDGVHPAGPGYAELADYILKFNTAREFFGLE
ncbi:GDSL-type esterase/lipase family protein [Pseudodesulfovibrio sp. zrk46]|uniref:GDSL-type esterase/lipase family protein n=1 Tax=Pseudodesulfovibrio sp. zrk46 TaxID=2725288 RepID=UPI001448CE04|nr:GDSL-type esterase/lipase family protein [Pseudodesulfovibrio sp. zrk46]QJB55131.1 G-D-S-L family lipolytic protein [Pseudodesulfovibrio sp. zrk46]